MYSDGVDGRVAEVATTTGHAIMEVKMTRVYRNTCGILPVTCALGAALDKPRRLNLNLLTRISGLDSEGTHRGSIHAVLEVDALNQQGGAFRSRVLK